MAFEKMTAKELYKILSGYFPNVTCAVIEYQKIGARALKLTCIDNVTLYFMWYDNTNWTLGTKLSRKRPEKQKKVQAKINALTAELEKLDAEVKAFESTRARLTAGPGASLDIFKIY